jgi:hypothetical protein
MASKAIPVEKMEDCSANGEVTEVRALHSKVIMFKDDFLLKAVGS